MTVHRNHSWDWGYFLIVIEFRIMFIKDLMG